MITFPLVFNSKPRCWSKATRFYPSSIIAQILNCLIPLHFLVEILFTDKNEFYMGFYSSETQKFQFEVQKNTRSESWRWYLCLSLVWVNACQRLHQQRIHYLVVHNLKVKNYFYLTIFIRLSCRFHHNILPFVYRKHVVILRNILAHSSIARLNLYSF